MKKKKLRQPTHRPAVTDVEKHWLFGVAIRDPKIFDETARHVTDEHFGESEAWLALVWRVVHEHFTKTGRLPGKKLIFTRCNAELQLNSDVVSAEGATELTKFVNTAFAFLEEDMPQLLVMDVLRRFLEDRLMDQAHEALGQPQTPLKLAAAFRARVAEAEDIERLGGGLPDNVRVIVYPPEPRSGKCRVVAALDEREHVHFFVPTDQWQREQFVERAVQRLGLSSRTADALDARILAEADEGVAKHTVVALGDAATAEIAQLRYLVPGCVPRGKLTCVTGQPDVGKSLLLLDLVARGSSGERMPGEPETLPRRRREPCTSIIVATEDAASDTIRPRLLGAGANLDYARIVTRVTIAGEPKPTLTFPSDLGTLERLVAEESAQLVVLDVLGVHLDAGYSMNDDAAMRRVLTPLAQLAERTGASIVFGRHPNKNTAMSALARGTGSVAIGAACRSELIVARHPEDPELRVVALAKGNNLSDHQRGTSPTFRIEPRRVSHTNPDGRVVTMEAPRIVWSAPCHLTADELLTAENSRGPSRVEQAEAIINTMMAAGHNCSTEIQSACEAAGISEATCRRARYRLGLVAQRTGGVGSQGRWTLQHERNGNQPLPDGP